MEKIYDENNQNNKNRKQIKLDGTTILSFAVALFAIVSLVTVGFNQISYAAPTDDLTVYPEKFTLKANVDPNKIQGSATTANLTVYRYYAVLADKSEKPVYCLERNLVPYDGYEYNKEVSEKLEDKGLLYLLANLRPNKNLTFKDGSELISKSGINYPDDENGTKARIDDNDKIQAWISQTAIWVYLGETKDKDNSDMTEAVIKGIRSETTLNDYEGNILISNAEPLYDSVISENGLTINQLIEKAKSFKNVKAAALNITKDNEVNISKDGKFYITKAITVNGSIDPSIGSYKRYSLKIVKAPEGTKVINKEGVELKDEELGSMPISEFFLKIPVDKVKEENKVVQLTATGTFDYLTGYGYRANEIAGAGPAQQIAIVEKATEEKNVPIELEINYTPDVPDTGMTTAQSIYFIGLVVLLCGVGIIYANTQPATNKQ